MKFFLPKQQNFFDLFSQLSEHSKQMAELFQKATNDMGNITEYAKQAKDLEHAADTVTHTIIDQLNRTFVTPIDREDIYLLAKELDDSIDLIENVISNLALYNCKESNDTLKQFGGVMVDAAKESYDLISHLQDPKKREELNATVVKIHELEDKGDEIFRQALHTLFSNTTDPIAVIKWKDIYEDLEQVMDMFQHVSDTVETIVVKAS
jgi:uncharacterized protein